MPLVSSRGPGLPLVEVSAKHLDDYRSIVGEEKIEEILDLAAKLKGARVLHLSATAFGGGVAELLGTLVPLLNDAGLQAEWRVIEGSEEFLQVTRCLHQGLQGVEGKLDESMKEVFLRYNKANASRWVGMYDFVVVHDPQPVAIKTLLQRPQGKWIWRCHIDLTKANPETWAFLKPFVEEYDGAIFTMPQNVPQDLMIQEPAIIPPSIDPLSQKNVPLAKEESARIVRRFGVDPEKPIVLQVSRFDPWKDPLGVIDAYRLVKKEYPEAQLVLISSMNPDDAEGLQWYEKLARHAGEDEKIFLLSNLKGVENLEVNAFQREADAVVQKSLREGFGLVVSEALWKEKPVVGARTGGIPLQVIDEVDGFLVDSVEECADKISRLLGNPGEAARMGARGKEIVRENFLSTRNLRDYLRLFLRLSRE
ncbi:MAG TPA: glycosyl transferase family 1 [Cyanobacteria bacterium UBA8530]|nr:glycosyl transferase family 1 [Cyanobacteria bacterium UBA8530]